MNAKSAIFDVDGTLIGSVDCKRSGLVTFEPGFGSKLVNKRATPQLGRSIAFEWHAEGLIVRLRMSKARLDA